MIYKYLTFSISITFISFIVGMMVNAVLKKTALYTNSLSNLNFIRSQKLNTWIGVGMVKWIVKNTPFKYLNQELTIKRKIDVPEVYTLRKKMTSAEIDHLIAFAFVAVFAGVKWYHGEFLFGFIIMIINTLMNLHPSLIQQQNKRRIDRLLSRYR